MLKEHLVDMVPYKNIIIEVLETVEPNDENYQVLQKRLFHKGFVLALDDFVYNRSDWDRFMPFIKLIKFDIIETPLDTLGPLVRKFRSRKKSKLLAEKVETYEEFRQAKIHGIRFLPGLFLLQAGYHGGQGHRVFPALFCCPSTAK